MSQSFRDRAEVASQRRRYKMGGGSAISARRHGLTAAGFHPDTLEKLDDPAPLWEGCDDFLQVPSHLLHNAKWKPVCNLTWKRSEDILLLKARSRVRAINRLAYSSWARNSRAVLLGDNLAVVLASGRSRAHTFPLLVQIRRSAALALGRNLRVTDRWHQSELINADEVSRAQDSSYGQTKD